MSPRGTSTDDSGVANTKESVSPGYGRILSDSAQILANKTSLSATYNLAKIIGSPVAITTNNYLTRDCTGQEDCLIVTEDESIEPFYNSDARWAYGVYSPEFLQINSFYHINKMMNRFYGNLKTILDSEVVIPYLDPTDPSSPYATSIPQDLFSKKANVQPDMSLTAYADCDLEDNAYFDATRNVLCFGHDAAYTEKLKMAQDPTLIYHEYGHNLVDIMMNMRNAAYHYDNYPGTTHTTRSRLGYLTYDEAGSMNEGIADFFSYYMNQRTHFGEWALGTTLGADRPMREDDDMHEDKLSADELGRLAFPDYITYVPKDGDTVLEDVHNAGMIMSHYLTALTEDLQSKCNLTKSKAQLGVAHVLNEVLSELGDLSSRGNDFVTGTDYSVNMNPDLSKIWLQANNPITYRRMSQYFAKYLYRIFVTNNSGMCPAGEYSKDDIETLLDQYGLLLFRSYNDNGNGGDLAWAGGVTLVDTLNRKKSELISKSLLKIDSRTGQTAFTIFDKQSVIASIMESFISSGTVSADDISSLTPSSYGYNNGNGKVSPGEIVGFYLNLYNNSNSTIAGARVLATDWAHMENNKPCSNLSDSYPTTTQGGYACSTLTSSNFDDTDRYHPVCMIEYSDGSSTQILSQSEYFKKMKLENGLLEKDCLDSTNTKTCMIRALRGADYSFLSKLDAKSNWQDTVTSNGTSSTFKSGNLIFFEVNKNIPFGTNVICRLRTTFTNCDDCYHDSADGNDDYEDWKYGGSEPFNIYNLKFQISD